MKKKVIIIFLSISLLVISFLLGRYLRINSLRNSQSDLEKSLQITTDKMNEIIRRNQEMEMLLNDSQKNLHDMSNKNEQLMEKISNIDELYYTMKSNINDISNSSADIVDKLTKMQQNQMLINTYIESMEKLMRGEEQ